MENRKEINQLINSEQKENLILAEQLLIRFGKTESEAKQEVFGFSLKLFFRLITTLLFNSKTNLDYQELFFFTPQIICYDGFKISLQMHNGSYCRSENGYRHLGYDWEMVEFGFPSEDDILLHEHIEMWDESPDFSAVGTVGSIPLNVVQELIDKHGGVNWLITLSIENLKRIYPR